MENAYEARLPGAVAGDQVTLSFSGPAVSSDPACAPSEALLEAAPALRADPPSGLPPAQLAAVVDVPPALVDRHARPWGSGDGIGFWVVAQLRCGVAVSNDRACVATIREGDVVESAVCAAAAEIRCRDAHEWVPVDGRPVVAGFAPTGCHRGPDRGRGAGADDRPRRERRVRRDPASARADGRAGRLPGALRLRRAAGRGWPAD